MHWKRCRAEAAARTDGLCQFCGLREGTEGHHLKYVRPELQEARWVVWLCSDCHDVADGATQERIRARVATDGGLGHANQRRPS